ncbi:NADH-quinone oxidoreductase subunit N [Saccharothrix obliqua]|uniref:NADH-quinone oxidoreductase subunit N n=1 Tax=Saccharothrix obliqua TaxID=2861747 RepID=UPI001C5E56AF|nr:NADH-quinone oxidoreductase subunit N [Saccharothrix obliqua]MBW4718668.1 NADH-quinone oxidoreductase subunit N [Saccharothrix obliqua]
MDPLALLPEILLAGAAVVGLLLGSHLPRRRQWLVAVLALVACVAGTGATAVVWFRADMAVFGGSYVVDVATNATRVTVLVAVVLVLGLAVGPLRGARREAEFVVLVLLSALGAVLLAGADDLLLLAASYLLASIPLYALAGFAKDAPGTEAALKFYLMGALPGVVVPAGVAVLLGVGGTTGYAGLSGGLDAAPRAAVAVGGVAVLAGLLFKAGAVPAHFWVPDVTEGARPVVAALVTTVPKIGAVVAVHRFITTPMASSPVDWGMLVAVIAAVTMTLGNLAAFFQDNVRRLLAYSTISQVGYLLVGVAAGRGDLALPGVLLYLLGYAVTNLGAFAVVCALPAAALRTDYRGLVRRRPWLAVSLVVLLLGLVGTPPTAVFAGKLLVFTAALDAGLGWLVVLAAVNTVASVFYYLRWIGPAVRGDATTRFTTDRWAEVTAYVTAGASVLLGVLTGPVLALVGP